MSGYHAYLFVHVATAIVWVGAASLQLVLGTRAVRAADPPRTLALVRDAEWTGLHVYLPANLLVLVSGILLVHEGRWGFGTLWVDIGLAAWAVSFVTGAALLGPGWARAGSIGDPEGRGADILQRSVRRLLFVTYVDLAVLTGVVFAMTVKPGAGEGAELVVGAVIVVAVIALGAMVLRVDLARDVERAGSRPVAITEARARSDDPRLYEHFEFLYREMTKQREGSSNTASPGAVRLAPMRPRLPA